MCVLHTPHLLRHQSQSTLWANVAFPYIHRAVQASHTRANLDALVCRPDVQRVELGVVHRLATCWVIRLGGELVCAQEHLTAML